jgi:hypothetical protein
MAFSIFLAILAFTMVLVRQYFISKFFESFLFFDIPNFIVRECNSILLLGLFERLDNINWLSQHR